MFFTNLQTQESDTAHDGVEFRSDISLLVTLQHWFSPREIDPQWDLQPMAAPWCRGHSGRNGVPVEVVELGMVCRGLFVIIKTWIPLLCPWIIDYYIIFINDDYIYYHGLSMYSSHEIQNRRISRSTFQNRYTWDPSLSSHFWRGHAGSFLRWP